MFLVDFSLCHKLHIQLIFCNLEQNINSVYNSLPWQASAQVSGTTFSNNSPFSKVFHNIMSIILANLSFIYRDLCPPQQYYPIPGYISKNSLVLFYTYLYSTSTPTPNPKFNLFTRKFYQKNLLNSFATSS